MRQFAPSIVAFLLMSSSRVHADDRPLRPSEPTGRPILLHPDNPHYFLFRGKPTVLITSTEHYGAVLNGDFDAIPYLDELHARGFNLTRTFSGTYREVPGSFKIEKNTLAPAADKYIAPWPHRHPRRSRRTNQVRPRPLERCLLRATQEVRGGRLRAWHRRRIRAVLPVLRGESLGDQPDELRGTTSTASARSPGTRRTPGSTAISSRSRRLSFERPSRS